MEFVKNLAQFGGEVWQRNYCLILAFGSEMAANITPIMLLTFMDIKLCCNAIGWHYCYHNTQKLE